MADAVTTQRRLRAAVGTLALLAIVFHATAIVVREGEAVLVTRSGAVPDGFEVFRRRIEGVLVARSYVMMDYDIPTEAVADAVRLTPGIESPTVAPLHREGWSAVRAMVPRDGAQRLMDELFYLGARGILLTDIHACRL